MEYVYQLLEDERERIVEAIKSSVELEVKAQLIGNKKLIESSIRILKQCEKFGISSSSIFTKLPKQLCQSASSDYRIVEDCETDDQKWWIEAKVESNPYGHVRLHQGDVVVEI